MPEHGWRRGAGASGDAGRARAKWATDSSVASSLWPVRAEGKRFAAYAAGAVVVLLGAALVATGRPWAPPEDRAARAQAAIPPAGTRAAVVWAVGDGADGSRRAKRLARLIAADRPHRFLYLGDVYERGTAREFRRHYDPVYGALARVTAPTPGNHEWGRRTEGYYPYWRRKKGRLQRPWYAFRLILSLNSQASHGPRSAQLRWLRAQLREPGTCRLAF